ncbi:MAG: permease-like cell division protein FtsX [Candidatus Dormiibacterota bacterium]
MGRPVTGASKRALTNGVTDAATSNGVLAKKNGAKTHRPGTNGAAPVQPVVKLTHVTKSFGRNAVLKDISLSVASGELVEITGPSGAGKTTLLRLIHGQLRPNGGEVLVQGRGLHRWWRRGLVRVRRDVAFIFQEHRLLPRLTALENLTLALQVVDPGVPLRTIRRRSLAALESVGLVHKRNAYPGQLSAGERQRVAVARALVVRPKVILADEPVAAVDDANAQMVMGLLEEAAAKGASVIVATHRHTFPSSRVLRLPTGRIWLNGSAKAASNGKHGGNANGNGNGHRNGIGGGLLTAPALWRLILPVPARPPKPVPKASSPPGVWRRLAAFAANAYRLVVLSGLRSWSRDLRLTAPALGTMALLLLLCGTLATIGISVEQVAAQQSADASLVRVYLAQDAAPDTVAALKARLVADPRVASVTDVSPEQALAEASSRPGLDNLASLSSTNPFPASLDVRVRLVTKVGAVAASVAGDPAVDPAYPTSYDPDTYSRLRHFALVVGAIGAGLLLFFGLVAYAVIANSMRGIAAARRQEVAIIRLLGARGWMLRGPFVVEGLMIGALAGAVAAAAVAAAWLLVTRFESATYAQVLPGVGPTAVQYVLAAILIAGLVLGSTTALLGFRKVRT